MSWFNASQLSSFAKQALSQAQKSIDRVLDIQAEESPWPDAVIPDYGDGKRGRRRAALAVPPAPLCGGGPSRPASRPAARPSQRGWPGRRLPLTLLLLPLPCSPVTRAGGDTCGGLTGPSCPKPVLQRRWCLSFPPDRRGRHNTHKKLRTPQRHKQDLVVVTSADLLWHG